MKVTLIYSPGPRVVREWVFQVEPGSTLADALLQSSLFAEYPDLEALIQNPSMLGIWGKAATPGQFLHDNDRIEIYRELRVDPKTARRERFNKQGAKMAGLFSGIRRGGKAGY